MFKANFGIAESYPYRESAHKKKNEPHEVIEESNKHNEERKRKLDLFEKIVGSEPMQQIDWIIDNGFNKFAHWWNSMESGMIYNPSTVKEFVPVTYDYTIRGGHGNKAISYTKGSREEKLEMNREVLTEFNNMISNSINSRRVESWNQLHREAENNPFVYHQEDLDETIAYFNARIKILNMKVEGESANIIKMKEDLDDKLLELNKIENDLH